MERVEVGVEEGYGDALETGLGGDLQVRDQGRLIQGLEDGAVGRQALIGFDDAGMQRGGLDDIQGEQVRAGLVADFERVPEPRRGDQQGAGAFSLQQRVGGHCGPDLDRLHPFGRKRRPWRDRQQTAHGLNRGVSVGG